MGFFALLFLLRLLLRRDWLAAAAAVLLLELCPMGSPEGWVPALFIALDMGAMAFVTDSLRRIRRVPSRSPSNHYFEFPLTLDAWYSSYVLFPRDRPSALAIYGFRTALAGRPAFGSLKLED